MDENERQRRARLRMKKRRRQVLIGRTIVALLLVILAALCVFVVRDLVGGKKDKVTPEGKATEAAAVPGTESTAAESESESAAETETEAVDVMAEAKLKAAQYDYDGAMELEGGDSYGFRLSDPLRSALCFAAGHERGPRFSA